MIQAEGTGIQFHSCPIEWWNIKKNIFPKLYPISKLYMTGQATSVDSERVFSVTGQILTSRRNRLSDETVDMLTFLYANKSI